MMEGNSCETVAELLPWLLNGTLEDSKRDRTLAHIEGCPSCREELASARKVWALFDSHPPSEVLVAYALEDPFDNRQELLDHLERCPRCREELDLVRANESIETLAWPRRKNTASVWRRSFFAAAAVALIAIAAGVVAWTSLKSPATNPPRVAALDEIVGRLTTAKIQLESERAELLERIGEGERLLDQLKDQLKNFEGPQLNIPVLELLPTNFRVRGVTEETVVNRSSGAVTLILATGIDTDFDPLRVTVKDQDGTLLLQAPGLVLQSSDDFTLQLPVASLPIGHLTLSIEGLEGGRWTSLETYRLRIED